MHEHFEGERPDLAPLARVVESIMRARGIRTFDELERRGAEEGVRIPAEGLRRIPEYPDWPAAGYGSDLDAVLDLTMDEKLRINDGFIETFMPPRPAES